MMQDTTALRAELIETARGMNLRGINVNKSGNVSARACRADGAEGFLITPTGMPYESLTPDDLVWIPLVNPPSLRNADGARRPSSEWEMHARVYLRRSDIDAVVHTHSCFATALACQDMPIPPFHYMVAAAGGHSIDVAPYATFGTPELARVAAEALAVKNACLLSHHGVIAAGGAHAGGRGREPGPSVRRRLSARQAEAHFLRGDERSAEELQDLRATVR